MVLRTLWRRPVRTLLTTLGIAIGVAAVVALSAMAEGLLRNYNSAVGLSNDLLVSQADAADVLFSSLDESLGQRIQGVPGVETVEPGMYTWLATDEMPFFLLFGYEPDTISMKHYRIVEGKPVHVSRQIAIGRRAADSLKKQVGDTLRLYGVPYQIVGIYETGQGMEESGGVVILSDAQSIAQKPRNVSLFQVGLRRGTDAAQVVQRIEALDKQLSATRASEYAGNESYSAMIQGFAWGIAAIAVLVGGLGMMNAMVMSVLERTREIGTLRALGWSRRRVVSLILREAFVISSLGGAAGIAIGIGLTSLAARVPAIGSFLEGAYSPGIFAQGLGTALCLGLLGGLYPAWRASTMLPAEALRYEGGGAGEAPSWLSRVGGQSFRNLWRRRTRTLLSATGIGIGVATLVMLGGFSKGMIDQLNKLAGSGGAGNITLMQKKVADLEFSALDESLVNQIAAMPGVKAASPMLMGFIMTSDMPFFLIAGMDPNSASMAHYQILEGRSIQRPNEVLVGKTAARNYKVGTGKTLTLFNNRYKVVGVYETGLAYEDGGGLLALREAQRVLNRPRSVSFIFVDVIEPATVGRVRAAIEARFPEAQVSLSSQFAQESDQMVQLQVMTDAISILALLVGGIVVANTMFMAIYERTREIGTLRAVGWRQSRILGQVVNESLLLCLVSAILGSGLGVGLLWLMERVPGADSMIQARWDASTFVSSLVLALLVGLLAGIYPAWRASRLQPVEALRYE